MWFPMATKNVNIYIFRYTCISKTIAAFVKNNAPYFTLKPNNNYIPINNIMALLYSIDVLQSNGLCLVGSI